MPGLLLLSSVLYLFSFAQFNHSYSLAQGELVNSSMKSDSPCCQRSNVSSSEVGLGFAIVLPGRKPPSWQFPPPRLVAFVKVASIIYTAELGG